MTFKLKCHRCARVWEYVGNKDITKGYKLYATCPRCRTSVKLKPYVKPINPPVIEHNFKEDGEE